MRARVTTHNSRYRGKYNNVRVDFYTVFWLIAAAVVVVLLLRVVATIKSDRKRARQTPTSRRRYAQNLISGRYCRLSKTNRRR